jgi:uncharacterized membrane protein YeaQ/YmgE (transglycosylase-associated protein family)
MLINLIIWILFGALAGWIASMIMGRDAQMGALANIIVGIIGAVVGGFLMNLLKRYYTHSRPCPGQTAHSAGHQY